MRDAQEILLSGVMVTNPLINKPQQKFEFIINSQLELITCVQVFTAAIGYGYIAVPVMDPHEIHNVLFELQQVRVNPELNNSHIISLVRHKIAELGVAIRPSLLEQHHQSPQFPLGGEMSETVRFYVHQNNNLVFLCDSAKPKLISKQSQSPKHN